MPSSRFSRTVSVGKIVAILGHVAQSQAGDLVRRAGRRSARRENGSQPTAGTMPDDRLDRRRAAGAVAAEEADDLAGADA